MGVFFRVYQYLNFCRLGDKIQISEQATSAIGLIYRKDLFLTSAKLYNFATDHLLLGVSNPIQTITNATESTHTVAL